MRAGRAEEAAALLPRLQASDTAWARATLLRCRGLLADSEASAAAREAAGTAAGPRLPPPSCSRPPSLPPRRRA